MSKKTLQWRNYSGELDVFEATKYFSDYYSNEVSSFPHKNHHHQQQHHEPWRGGRRSLDVAVPFRKSALITLQNHHRGETPRVINEKTKLPSSPGGRLASFLNSLFNQTKKRSKSKSKSKPEKDGEDEEEESPHGGLRGRRRRWGLKSSRSTTTTTITTSDSVLRKPYKDLTILSDLHKNHKIMQSLEKFNGVCEKQMLKMRIENEDGDKEEDDANSDTSSDLFDLPNSELLKDFYYSSSGLPVYETTQMDSIKRGSAPISTTTI